MPTYFFDVYDGEVLLRDLFGVELETVGEAAAQAAALLPDIARDRLPGTVALDFTIDVRDETGRVVHRAALLFRAQWVPEAVLPAGEPRAAPCAAPLVLAAARRAARGGSPGAGRLHEAHADPIAVVPCAVRAEDGAEGRRLRLAPANL